MYFDSLGWIRVTHRPSSDTHLRRPFGLDHYKSATLIYASGSVPHPRDVNAVFIEPELCQVYEAVTHDMRPVGRHQGFADNGRGSDMGRHVSVLECEAGGRVAMARNRYKTVPLPPPGL